MGGIFVQKSDGSIAQRGCSSSEAEDFLRLCEARRSTLTPAIPEWPGIPEAGRSAVPAAPRSRRPETLDSDLRRNGGMSEATRAGDPVIGKIILMMGVFERGG